MRRDMRKQGALLLGCMIMILGGCSNRNKMDDFIPTPTPSPTPIVDENDLSEGTAGETDTPLDELDLSTVETTPKYVKMDKFGSTLNVRATPSTDGDIIGSLVHREKVDVIEIKDGWAAFVNDNKIKYVKAEYLVDDKPDFLDPPTATPTPVPTPEPTPTPAPTAKPTKEPTPAPEEKPTVKPDNSDEPEAPEETKEPEAAAEE